MKKCMLVLLALLLAGIVYNVWDNHRFVVVEQEITVPGLPADFDGYQVLQISDLHGKTFGEKQANLCEAVNALEYDVLLFTGDMNQYGDSSEAACRPVLELIAGIERDTPMLWVDGNTGPFALETAANGAATGKLTQIGEQLTALGVQVLAEPVAVERGGARIWFAPELSRMDLQMSYGDIAPELFAGAEDYQAAQAHGAALQAWYGRLQGSSEIKIRVDHYPLQADMTAEMWDAMGLVDYDLSIAGHYHGGQIRIPFYGALYIPAPTIGICGGYFPPQTAVKGLNQIVDCQQYVSAGLGASASIPLLHFRLFNTPEINLITLRCAAAE